jgi:hypothetical protein
MQLRTYPLDTAGRWQRQPTDVIEDLVVACSHCGHQPAGQVQGCGERFRFLLAGDDNKSSSAL